MTIFKEEIKGISIETHDEENLALSEIKERMIFVTEVGEKENYVHDRCEWRSHSEVNEGEAMYRWRDGGR